MQSRNGEESEFSAALGIVIKNNEKAARAFRLKGHGPGLVPGGERSLGRDERVGFVFSSSPNFPPPQGTITPRTRPPYQPHASTLTLLSTQALARQHEHLMEAPPREKRARAAFFCERAAKRSAKQQRKQAKLLAKLEQQKQTADTARPVAQ